MNDIVSYNITSGMIIIDDIMSEIVLEISRVRRTSEIEAGHFMINQSYHVLYSMRQYNE
jgi:hypothetical protein